MIEELKLYKDIDINFIRLSKPVFNSVDLPLSGLYNSLDNIEYPNYPLKNKFKNFTTPINGGLGLDNLFMLKTSFDKLLTDEKLEGLIILTNNSPRDITIKNMEISFIFEADQNTFLISLPDKDNTLFLSRNQSYSLKIKKNLKEKGKYGFDIKFWTKSFFYDQQYYNLKQRGKIKESTKYKIIDSHVEYYNNKIFNFSVSDPFDIKTKFKMNQLKDEYFIEINIKNISKYNLTIPDLIIKPNQRNNIYLKPTSNLEEMQLNVDGFDAKNNKENNNNIILNNSKIFCLQPDEDINLFFKSASKEIFLLEEKFTLYIKWLNIFDFSPKNFQYEFKNELDIFNNYFVFMITERPLGNIILGHDFPLIIQFVSKQPKRNLELTISEYNKNKKDNEVEIIIKEYKFELNDKCQKYNVNIRCKSDKTGIVIFRFNCVENVQLI